MRVTRIRCDICKEDIPQHLCTEVSFKYLISDKLETMDLCRTCYGRVVDFMNLLEEVSEKNELSGY